MSVTTCFVLASGHVQQGQIIHKKLGTSFRTTCLQPKNREFDNICKTCSQCVAWAIGRPCYVSSQAVSQQVLVFTRRFRSLSSTLQRPSLDLWHSVTRLRCSSDLGCQTTLPALTQGHADQKSGLAGLQVAGCLRGINCFSDLLCRLPLHRNSWALMDSSHLQHPHRILVKGLF